MRSAVLQFSLPALDEMRLKVGRSRHIGVAKTCSMNVNVAVPALNLLRVEACRRVSIDHDDRYESMTIQQEHLKSFTAQHLEWGFVRDYGNILTCQEGRGLR